MFTDSKPPAKPKAEAGHQPMKMHTEKFDTKLLESFGLTDTAINDFSHPDLPVDFYGVLLYPTNSPQPLIASALDVVTIGRRDPNGRITPIIDLAKFNGEKHGVSRSHAQISLIDQRYYIQDLGSTNGTWVNHLRIGVHHPYPLDNGVVVRFGHLAFLVELIYPKQD